MKTIKFSLIAIAAMAAVSCAKEITPDHIETPEVNPNLVEVTLTATGESDEETKAVFSGYPKIAWEGNEEISLLGTNTGNQKLTATGKGHQTTFTGYANVTDEVYYAVYPYDANVKLNEDGTLANVTVPAVQTATAGSFDPKAYIAVAKSEDKENLYFKSVGGFVKFQLEDAENVKAVIMRSNTGKNMACTSSKTSIETMSHGGEYTNASDYVKLEGEFVTGKAYFMVVRAQPYDGGVTFYIEYKDGTVLSRRGESALFESGKGRNHIRNVGTLKKADFTTPDKYALYTLGYDIVVGNKTFNKTNSSATHITGVTSSKIETNGLYFVDPDITVNLGTGFSQLAIIGNSASKRATINRGGGYLKVAGSGSDDDYFVLSGVNLNITPGTASYAIRIESIKCEDIIIDNCSSVIPAAKEFIYSSVVNCTDNMIVKNSEFIVGAGNTNNFINFNQSQTVGTITIDNNVFYSANIVEPATSFTLISAGSTTVTDLTINKNTFYGAYPAAGGSNITNCPTTNMTITNNMFGVRADATANSNMVGAKISGSMNVSNNASYKNGTSFTIGGIASKYQGTGTAESPKSVGIYTTNWDPAAGKFTIHNEFGATR